MQTWWNKQIISPLFLALPRDEIVAISSIIAIVAPLLTWWISIRKREKRIKAQFKLITSEVTANLIEIEATRKSKKPMENLKIPRCRNFLNRHGLAKLDNIANKIGEYERFALAIQTRKNPDRTLQEADKNYGIKLSNDILETIEKYCAKKPFFVTRTLKFLLVPQEKQRNQ